jgi:hypothetical protein
MVDVILGLQWGDEGKGKIVDYFAKNYDVIARFQGGPNAGHTLYVNDKKIVLHQIPSGIFHSDKINLIGNGVVLDPVTLKKECEAVESFGVDYKKIVYSYIPFTKPISKLIFDQLTELCEDNYFNRVQAALNFVQFLPYGLPEFDTADWYYFGIATPPESFILGYSDCDSKSIFFAAILSELIPLENIILIHCTVNSSNVASSGEHMMVAVSELQILGETVAHNDKNYLLLETTTPIAIGQFHWTSFRSNYVVNLA